MQLNELNANLTSQLQSSRTKGKLTQKQLDIANKQIESLGTSIGEKVTHFSWGVAFGLLTTLLITVL